MDTHLDLSSLSDPELMEMTKTNEQKAFVILVQRHQQSLWNFFRRMGIPAEESEDLAQEVFLRLFQSRLRYRPLAKFSTFLYCLARNVWIDRMRRWKKTRPLSAAMSVATYDNNLLRTDARIDLQAALNRLSEKLRIVVVMSIYQGLRYQEIADILNIPLGTVKSRVFHAMQQLKEILHVEEFSFQER